MEANVSREKTAPSTELVWLCKEGRLKEAVDGMRNGLHTNSYLSLLQVCTDKKALEEGRRVYSHMVLTGSEKNTFLMANVVSMFLKCGSLEEARQVFDGMPERNLRLWTTMIGGYSRQGHYREALVLFNQMQRAVIYLDSFVFPCILRACAGILDL